MSQTPSLFADRVPWGFLTASASPLIQASLATRYVASIYWAFTTMTTVGYGDIVVTTTLERCFCVFGMLIGATVFGYIVGNVSVMMESFDMQSALRTQKMDRVKVGREAAGNAEGDIAEVVTTVIAATPTACLILGLKRCLNRHYF